jgi:hypothetical protein
MMNMRWLYPHRILVAVLVAAALAVGLMTVLVIRQQQDQASGQVYLEAGASVGSNPFVPLIPPSTTVGENAAGNGGVASFQATASADDRPTCDTDKIISYLTTDLRAGEAWVRALNFDRTLVWSGGSRIEVQQIPAYIHELTPRVLTEDLRVTNYQFANGAALPVQSVLQEGTAILVDGKGVARVRCASGNPLSPMIQSKAPTVYRGTAWPSFHPQRVVVTQHAPQCGHDESDDGQRCRPVSACPHNEHSGNGQCNGPTNLGPSEDRVRPDEQRWWDRPDRPNGPPHAAEYPGESDPPGRLSQPDEPTGTDEPGRSDRPGRLDEPSRSDRPTPPVRSPHEDKSTPPEKPERADRSDRADRSRKPPQEHNTPPSTAPESADKGDHSEKSPRPERPVPPKKDEHPDKSKRSYKPAQPGDSDHPDRPNRANKSDKSEKSAQPERSEKSEKLKEPDKSKGEAARQIERE